jgi:putative aldouronate transport system permease protein
MTKLGIMKKNLFRDRYLYLMLIPIVAFYILFEYKPMYGLQIAFKNYSLYKGITESPWVGLDNFKEFFSGPYFTRTLVNTFVINILGLIFQFPAPIILALLLNEIKNKLFKKITQTMTYLPHFISSVIIVGIITNLLSPSIGLVNILLQKLGGESIYFMIKPEWFRLIYISMGIWVNVGFNSIIYIAALASVPVELYESAIIDGANRWKQVWHITIPSILPIIMIMLILRIGSLLASDYQTIMLLQTDANLPTSDVIMTYVYRAGIQMARYGYAAAVGIFNSVVALILVALSNMLSKKTTNYGIW